MKDVQISLPPPSPPGPPLHFTFSDTILARVKNVGGLLREVGLSNFEVSFRDPPPSIPPLKINGGMWLKLYDQQETYSG